METIAGFPYVEVLFDKEANIVDPTAIDELEACTAEQEITDLFVLSHGWNNHIAEARELYEGLLTQLRDAMQRHAPHARAAVLAVLWPSKKFADKELIPGGAAGVEDFASEVLRKQLEALKGGFDDPGADAKLEEAKGLIDGIENDPEVQDRFVELVRSLVPADEREPEAESGHLFFDQQGRDLLRNVDARVRPAARDGGDGGAAGLNDLTGSGDDSGDAAGLLDFAKGIKNGALNVLNYATYYQMKERAGLVGKRGLNPVLRRLRAARATMRVHLVGHSFGGRLVTAAASGDGDAQEPVAETMTLLQAAFSHHGFARRFDGARDGFFRTVLEQKKVAGPILITCTANDTAVGKLYPLASLFAGQDASGIGDRNSIWGGIGCNGAQFTPEAIDASLLPIDGGYSFEASKVYNLNADSFIKGHSDICKPEVAHAIASAVAQLQNR